MNEGKHNIIQLILNFQALFYFITELHVFLSTF